MTSRGGEPFAGVSAKPFRPLSFASRDGIARHRWAILFALTGIAGVVLRVFMYRSSTSIPSSDEAVGGLMVRHFVHGQFTVFIWGASYGGTQELLLTVPWFAIAGSSWFALRIIPDALSAVAVLLVWRVGLRTIGKPGAAVAAGLLWLWPPFTMLLVVRAEGFHASNLVYCAGLLLLGLRIVERPDRTRIAWFGFVLGLAFWETSQIIPVALVTIAWVIWKAPRALRQAWVGVACFALGALPWIVWNVRPRLAFSRQPEGGLRVVRAQPAATREPARRDDARAALAVLGSAHRALGGPRRRAYCGPARALRPTAGTGAERAACRSSTSSPPVFPLLYALPSKTAYIEGWPEYTERDRADHRAPARAARDDLLAGRRACSCSRLRS